MQIPDLSSINSQLLGAIQEIHDLDSDPYYAHRVKLGLALDKIEEAILTQVLSAFSEREIKIQEIGGGIGQLSLALGLLGYSNVLTIDSAQSRSATTQRLIAHLGLSGRVTSLCRRYPDKDIPQADLILGTNTIGWWTTEPTIAEWDVLFPSPYAILDLERFGRHRPLDQDLRPLLEKLHEIYLPPEKLAVPGLSSTHIYFLSRKEG